MSRGVTYLLIIILLYLLLSALDQIFIFTDEFLYRNLSDEFSQSVIEALLTSENRFGWVAFVILPIVILVKVLFTTCCISTGAILTGNEFSFNKTFHLATYSELIFLFSQVLFSITLFVNRDSLTLDNAANYFPGSMLSFLGAENVVPWLHYPLQTLNIFEVAYVLLISWLLSKQWKPDFVESLNIVIPSYGIGLILWMALVVFLTLQIT